jgi:hypothetical protein
LPRSHSHNRPTNPRNKTQLKATRKRNSRSKGLRQSAQLGVDHLRGGGGLSAGARRTGHKHRADHPKMPPELPVLHLEKWTVRALPGDHPHSPRGPSDKPRVTKSTGQNGSKRSDARTHKEHDEHLVSRLLTGRPRAPGGLSATHGQSNLNSKTNMQLHLSVHGSPKRLELLR